MNFLAKSYLWQQPVIYFQTCFSSNYVADCSKRVRSKQRVVKQTWGETSKGEASLRILEFLNSWIIQLFSQNKTGVIFQVGYGASQESQLLSHKTFGNLQKKLWWLSQDYQRVSFATCNLRCPNCSNETSKNCFGQNDLWGRKWVGKRHKKELTSV